VSLLLEVAGGAVLGGVAVGPANRHAARVRGGSDTCRTCGRRRSWYGGCGCGVAVRWVVVAASLPLLMAVVVAATYPHVLVADLVCAYGSVVLSAVDVERRIIPRPTLYPLAVLTVVVALFQGGVERCVVGLVGALVAWLFFSVMRAVTRRGMGLGDVRLAAWLGFVVAFAGGSASGAFVAGYAWLAGSVVASLVELSCYVATGRYHRRFVVPFAPALCAGALVAVAVGHLLSVSLRI